MLLLLWLLLLLVSDAAVTSTPAAANKWQFVCAYTHKEKKAARNYCSIGSNLNLFIVCILKSSNRNPFVSVCCVAPTAHTIACSRESIKATSYFKQQKKNSNRINIYTMKLFEKGKRKEKWEVERRRRRRKRKRRKAREEQKREERTDEAIWRGETKVMKERRAWNDEEENFEKRRKRKEKAEKRSSVRRKMKEEKLHTPTRMNVKKEIPNSIMMNDPLHFSQRNASCILITMILRFGYNAHEIRYKCAMNVHVSNKSASKLIGKLKIRSNTM